MVTLIKSQELVNSFKRVNYKLRHTKLDLMDPQQLDQNSLEQNLNNIDQEPNQLIQQEVQDVDYTLKIEQIHQSISRLNEEEQILKQTLKSKEKLLLDTFAELYKKKSRMRDLVLNQINRTQIQLDIGLTEEFQMLKTLIANQKKQISDLKDQISKQGLSGRNNDQQFIKMLFKIQQMQKEIEIGRKFASTQYVRDYLDKPQVYKVAYEEVKYEFEIRAKIKQSLQQEKQHYLKKKQQLIKAMTRQKQIQQELLQQKDNLLKELKSLS